MKNLKYGIVYLFILFSCTETELDSLEGSLVGHVTCYNPLGNVVECSDVSVTVEGADPALSVQTDEDGKFVLEKLKMGVYDLVLSREGFGTNKIISYPFVGGMEPASVTANLSQLPEGKISKLELEADSVAMTERSFTIEGRVTLFFTNPQVPPRFVRYFISADPEVSPTNYYDTGLTFISDQTSNYFFKKVPFSRYKRGSELYVIVYPCGYNCDDYYVDRDSGINVYPNINVEESWTSSMTVPDM